LKFVGLDLAGSPKRPTGFCTIDLKRYTHCKILYSDSEILAAVSKSKARFVAIDAPLALPKGRHCLGEHCRGRAHFRACDLALRRMRIKFFPITIGPMRMLTARGIRLKQRLGRLGIEVVETFPGAAQDILSIPRKQHDSQELQSSLIRLGCRGEIETRKLTGDELDAVSCAMVARDYGSGHYLAIGDPSEIMMILPNL
jgi:predicted nuclease with RNAse H fold